MRHQLTTEERQRGFRNAVLSLQTKYALDFNQAVQILLRKSASKAGFNGNWQSYRLARQTS